MMSSLDSKRIFLVATENVDRGEFFKNLIQENITNATVYVAQDGTEALAKMKNVPPHIVIADSQLPKVTGEKIMEDVFADKMQDRVSFILVGEMPETEMFLDDVVTGRLQFLTDPNNKEDVNHALVRALNFWSHSEPGEFFLKFLAPNDLLLRQGDKADFVYIVRKGTLRASAVFENEPVELGIINAGEFVGEMSYITKAPRNADVIAETDCELIEIPVNTFEKVLYQKPGWAKALMVTLSNRLKVANESKKNEIG